MKWNQLVDTFGQLRRCVFADLQKSCLYPNHLCAFYSEAILLLFLLSLTGWQFCCDCRAAVCLTNPGRLTDRQWERNAQDYSYILDLSPSTVQKGCEQRTVLRLLSLTDPSLPPLQARARICFCSMFLYNSSGQTEEGSKLQLGEGPKDYLWDTVQLFGCKLSCCSTSNTNLVHGQVSRIMQRQMLRYSSDKSFLEKTFVYCMQGV